MNSTNTLPTKDEPAETLALAPGSAFLRDEADTNERIGKLLGFDDPADEARQKLTISNLRNTAQMIDDLCRELRRSDHLLRIIYNNMAPQGNHVEAMLRKQIDANAAALSSPNSVSGTAGK